MTKTSRLLCHYTSIEGLAGIVKNRQIWATHPYYLNDASELKGVFSYIFEEKNAELHSRVESNLVTLLKKKLFAERKLESLTNEIPQKARAELIKWSNRVIKELKDNISEFVFVTSFTNSSGIDSNYHWMTYTPESTGYCLVFEESYIDSLAFKDTEMTLQGIEYTENYQDSFQVIAEKISESIFHEYRTLNKFTEGENKKAYEKEIESIRLEMTKVINKLLALYKPEAFKGELESRLVSLKLRDRGINKLSDEILPEIEFRYSNSGTFIPYQPIPIDPSRIKKVIIRSDSHIDLKIKSCELFLRKELGENCPEVVASKATLRTSL